MMEDEVVRRRGWLTREEFLDLLGAASLVPGPTSTELALHIGRHRGGLKGLVVTGCAFILPAMLLVMLCAWAYVRFGSLPATEHVLYGVKPVIIAVVLQALWGLGRTALKTKLLVVVAAAVVALGLLGLNLLPLLVGAGLVVVLVRRVPRGTAAEASVPLLSVLLVFAKLGAILYGSGYVLLAFLRQDLVESHHWLTASQLLDAVAVGQVTPGPVFTTATFIGYLLAGPVGAVVATVGIFLPAFVYVGISGALIPRIRRSPLARDALDGVNAASWALMAVVTLTLARSAIVDVPTAVLAVASAVLLVRFRLNSLWLVLAGALTGWLCG